MKHILPIVLSFLCFVHIGGLLAQNTPLYAGQYYGNELHTVDTTGLNFTPVDTVEVTVGGTDIAGIFGLAMHPISEEMYICYQDGGGAGSRRLGTIDTETGIVTDIAVAGNIIDMDFGPDGTLYGSTGGFSPDYSFVIIDITTGANTFIFDYTPSTYGGGMAYNPFADNMYYQNNNGAVTIDLGTLIETVGSPVGSEGETQAMVILNDTLGWQNFYGTLYSFNPMTEVFTSTGVSIPSYHAFAFGPVPCTPIEITASATEICEGEEVTLSASTLGTVSWTDGIVDGEAFTIDDPGTYTYTVSSDNSDVCTEGNTITVEVDGLPNVTATADPSAYCEGETINLSYTGDADVYTWNDGEELDLTPLAGDYTYTLASEFSTGECAGVASISTVDVTVNALPTITATANATAHCVGNNVVLNGAGGISYTWDEAGVADGVPFLPGAIGTYTYNVNGTDANGCINTASIDIEVVEDITLSATLSEEIEGADGEIDLSVSGGAPTFTFDWDNDGTGDFDDSEDLTGLTGGTYVVTVKNNGGCEATETYILGSQVGIDSPENNTFSIYPNPTVGVLNIELAGNFQYEVIAINGAVLFTGKDTDKATISLNELSNGVYFIKVQTAHFSTTKKVTKK